VTIACEELTIFSGFSPNNDGVNDGFTILGIESFPDNELTIFNRWGNEVFFRQGYTNEDPWTGTFEFEDLPDGTYFFVLELGDKSEPRSGYIQIHR